MSSANAIKYRIENIAPILFVSDMRRSITFYVEVLGFKNAEWGDGNFASVDRDNCGIYLCKGAQGVPGTWVWIGFDGDIDKNKALPDQFFMGLRDADRRSGWTRVKVWYRP